MKQYIRIYLRLLQMNFQSLMAYKINVINSIVSSTSWCLFILLSMFLLTSNVKTFYGWSRNEMLLLAGSFNAIFGLFYFLFSKNFERFSNLVHFGQLDAILLKPLDSQFLISFWLCGYTSIIRMTIGILFNLYILNKMHVHLTVVNVIGFFALVVVSVILIYSIWFITSTLIIWFTRLSNLINLLYSINGIGRYPKEMFKAISYGLFLFFLPLTFILITPTKFIIQKALFGDFIGLIVFAFLFFIFSRLFWKFALRSYTSASG